MNETQLIRRQLALERDHLGAAARAGAQALAGQAATPGGSHAPLQQACREYLECVLGWYEARDRRLAQLAADLGAEDPRRTAVQAILAERGSGREAQALLAAAGTRAAGWASFIEFLSGPWSARRDALERLLAHDARAADWRLISGIDADGILEERTRFARVRALAPARAD